MNVGTIVEADMLKVRLVRSRAAGTGHTGPIARGGRVLGEVEEYFIEMLVPGDTFVFGGEILKYEALVENEVYVSRSTAEDPKVPAYEGGKFPLSTYLADRVRRLLAEPKTWPNLPEQVREWLRIQQWRSTVPGQKRSSGRDLPARR
jgi:ATP-dependent Lhr-like helicase